MDEIKDLQARVAFLERGAASADVAIVHNTWFQQESAFTPVAVRSEADARANAIHGYTLGGTKSSNDIDDIYVAIERITGDAEIITVAQDARCFKIAIGLIPVPTPGGYIEPNTGAWSVAMLVERELLAAGVPSGDAAVDPGPGLS